MAGYNDTREKIIETLMGRPSGTEISPQNHQDYALSMLEYIRSLELLASGSLIGLAEENTMPIQPNTSRVSYFAYVDPKGSKEFTNFRDITGNPIIINNDKDEALLVFLVWDMRSWAYDQIQLPNPYIGENGNWWINGVDTKIKAEGSTPYIGVNGNWWIDGVDSNKPARGQDGTDIGYKI